MFVWPILLALFAAITGFYFSQKDSREELIELKGKLMSLEIVPSDSPGRHSFVFTVDKFLDKRFKVARLSQGDEVLFPASERKGSELEFSVERSLFEANSLMPVPVLELSSEKNVYLHADAMGALLRKGRLFSGFLCLVSLLVIAAQLARIRRLYLAEVAKPPQFEVYDPLFVLAAKLWFRFRGGRAHWVRAVLTSDQERLARKPPRPTTSAPKHIKAVALLLKYRGNVDVQNKAGQTALHIAAMVGSLEATKLLLEKGAQVDVIDKKGQTPLMIAVSKGSLGIVSQLIEAGANVLFEDDAGVSVLACAEKNARNVATLELITKAVAKAEADAKAKALAKAAEPPTEGGEGPASPTA